MDVEDRVAVADSKNRAQVLSGPDPRMASTGPPTAERRIRRWSGRFVRPGSRPIAASPAVAAPLGVRSAAADRPEVCQRMTEDDVLDLFRRSGALLEGHFVLSSGLHSDRYLQSALVLQHPERAAALGAALAALAAPLQPTVVLSPALGGIVIGQEVGRALGLRAIFAERQDGALVLRRGFSLGAGDRVLIVEDVLTTGGSTRETAEVARRAGAEVVGACAIVDRGHGEERLDVPLHALVRLEVPAFPRENCPLCSTGVPVTKPGSRA
jgi:orotate phosphoribosyltransferase